MSLAIPSRRLPRRRIPNSRPDGYYKQHFRLELSRRRRAGGWMTEALSLSLIFVPSGLGRSLIWGWGGYRRCDCPRVGQTAGPTSQHSGTAKRIEPTRGGDRWHSGLRAVRPGCGGGAAEAQLERDGGACSWTQPELPSGDLAALPVRGPHSRLHREPTDTPTGRRPSRRRCPKRGHPPRATYRRRPTWLIRQPQEA